jgi:hypothetical protein
VLGIVARQPLSGRVKTRLSPPLSPREACALYETALRESVARFATGPYQPVLCWTGRRNWFARAFPETPLLWQGRGDLGARLTRITAGLFAAGGGPVALAGADSPDLPLALLAAALDALRRADAAMVPSADGGYALLALNRPAPQLFAGIPWGTPEVSAATRRRAAEHGLRLAVTKPWDDLDDRDSLARLLARSPECATARHARAHLGHLLRAGGG